MKTLAQTVAVSTPGAWLHCRTVALVVMVGVCAISAPTAHAGTQSSIWNSYLDYAYVYVSGDQASLETRLAQYGQEAGLSLDRYVAEYFETLAPLEEEAEASTRRQSIAYLLQYLASGRPEVLERAVTEINRLDKRLERHENRFWYQYIHAHRALEKHNAYGFVDLVLDLWLKVVVPLEGPFSTLQTLSLEDAPNSWFVSALPYLYENIARLILIRSQQMGLNRNMDPLAALVRLLGDRRVGAFPEVIPAEASSKGYLERIVARLGGPESDNGSLTFTLALFEASKAHDQARGLLASENLSAATLEAMRQTAGFYETAFRRADTAQGRCAVYTRVLRQIGELYAAQQRLGVDPEIEIPFTIEGAIGVYAELHTALDSGWEELGYRANGRKAYLEAMRGLWSEIQEASLNAADYYLTRAVEQPHRADPLSRNASRVFTRYLAFFEQFASKEQEALPESAYFAAFEAARGLGDAYLIYASDPTPAEVELATRRYRTALALFPFDRELWSALTGVLGRHGRESEYMELARPVAEWVARSRAIDNWVEGGEPHADSIGALRRALSDTLVVMYLGFADASGIDELDAELLELQDRRVELAQRIDQLIVQRDAIRFPNEPGMRSPDALPAAPELEEAQPNLASLEEVAREIAEKGRLLEKLDQQIAARSRSLPVYREALGSDGFMQELRSRRDHPVHKLLRRMYHENRS